MEVLGKTFLMVIEPLDFDMKQKKVFHPEFGFVIASESEFFRDIAVKLCKKYHRIRRTSFGPKILTSIRKRMRDYNRKTFNTEREFLELVALFFDIAYYTAVSHDKDAHLRKFSVVDGATFRYFGYCGSKNYNSLQLIEKMQDKVEGSKVKHGVGSYFEVSQVFH